jgi:hypothetical protein
MVRVGVAGDGEVDVGIQEAEIAAAMTKHSRIVFRLLCMGYLTATYQKAMSVFLGDVIHLPIVPKRLTSYNEKACSRKNRLSVNSSRELN